MKTKTKPALRTMVEVFSEERLAHLVACMHAFEREKRAMPSWLLSALWKHRVALKRVRLPEAVTRAFLVKQREAENARGAQ